jgi:hypothetical protein
MNIGQDKQWPDLQKIDPPIPLMTPKGRATAHWMIWSGPPENDIFWVCFQDDTGECWTWEDAEIRSRKNRTLKRNDISFLEKDR